MAQINSLAAIMRITFDLIDKLNLLDFKENKAGFWCHLNIKCVWMLVNAAVK